MTKEIFTKLDVYHDVSSGSAAMNMAVDQALLETATVPLVRFYRWNHPALSFGYFGRFADVTGSANERELVRRWTGGGVVLHGNDLTYSVVIPAGDSVFAESSISIYEKIHQALQNVLATCGYLARLATVAAVADRGTEADSYNAINDRGYNAGTCFANPVHADVLISGRKVAGAAQRRTRRGLLQQGSIQQVELSGDFEERFARELSANCNERKIDEELFCRARELAEQKYGTKEWLECR
jgi:lipoate-protein ligase A